MRHSNGTVRVISREILFDQFDDESKTIEEIVIEERLLWMYFRRTFRRIDGTIFIYKRGNYTEVNWLDSEVKNYFKLPVHEN